ncbi:hypothetical protein LTR39_002993 [Cryomyces antarcticus]|nr:hypothetical protein LTR39_002993 [Cryomyces antarcticus]
MPARLTSADSKPARRRKRKSRTQVSSDSSSDSEADADVQTSAPASAPSSAKPVSVADSEVRAVEVAGEEEAPVAKKAKKGRKISNAEHRTADAQVSTSKYSFPYVSYST